MSHAPINEPANSSRLPVVFVVDDEAGIRSALRRLLRLAGLAVETYASGPAFLESDLSHRAGCVLLDMRMPQMSGLEVQSRLNQRRIVLPVIFLTGAADVPMAVTAMRNGAHDFIEKPYDDEQLVARVRQCLEPARDRLHDAQGRNVTIARLRSLTPREREVLDLVAAGRTAKEIARQLGTSHRTVEVHRAHLMEKLAASSLADLVRMQLLATAEPVRDASAP
ncbi:MAG: response regulator transcription factor [Proteobacteria bacterium]|nr:response regulator transcription factor [Pseudomonadota bacterium]